MRRAMLCGMAAAWMAAGLTGCSGSSSTTTPPKSGPQEKDYKEKMEEKAKERQSGATTPGATKK